MPIVECIPNVSEGRRAAVIDACAAAIRGAGAALFDVHQDGAHHRSVFTFAGEPRVVLDAVDALFDVAVPAIDLRTHHGVHPRVGAVDVVPFVPIRGVTLADCVALARQAAERVSRRHDLPVYLYEAAATRPDRRRLEHIRRGGFEGLPARMALPEGVPDFGPARPHPTAGASVVGAREPLVAFNVNLASTRLDVAKAIARVVRESSGGLPGVKALGLSLADRDLVQVSMNLTDLARTPVHVALARVVEEARRHDVPIAGTELVGLVPASVLEQAGADALRLTAFSPRSVLEHRLAEFHLGS